VIPQYLNFGDIDGKEVVSKEVRINFLTDESLKVIKVTLSSENINAEILSGNHKEKETHIRVNINPFNS
jgi:hypothetical protein